MNVFDLFARIALDTSDYEKGLSDAGKKTNSFGDKLKNGLKTAGKIGAAAIGAVTTAATAVTAAFVKGTSEVAEYGDNIDKMSQKLGLSAEAYQKWDFVLGQSGADINSMSTGLKTLTNKIDEAKNGSADAADKFAKLGISMEQLNTMSREELFEASIKGFQGMADSTERAALANDLFGKSGQELTPLFNTSAEQTEELIAQAEKYGMVMSNDAVKASAAFQDSLDVLKRSMGGLKNNMMAEFLPSITSVMDGLSLIFSGDDSGIAKITEGVNGFATQLITAVSKVFDKLPDMLSIVSTVVTEALPKLVTLGSHVATSLVDSISDTLSILLEKAPEIITDLVGIFQDNFPELINSGAVMIEKLASGLSSNIPLIIESAFKVIETLLYEFTDPWVIKKLLDSAILILESLAMGLVDNLPILIDMAPVIIENLATALLGSGNLEKLITTAINLLVTLGVGLIENVGTLLGYLPDIFDAIITAFKNVDWGEIGVNIIEGIKAGLISMWQSLKDTVGEIVSKITGKFEGDLDIHSPSGVFKDYGEYMMQGLEIGMKNSAGEVMETVDDIVDEIKNRLDEAIDMLDLKQDVWELEYELWEQTEGQSATEIERYEKQIEMLNKQAEQQAEVVAAQQAAYDASVAKYGAESEASLEFQKQLLQEQIEYQKMLNEVDGVIDKEEEMGYYREKNSKKSVSAIGAITQSVVELGKTIAAVNNSTINVDVTSKSKSENKSESLLSEMLNLFKSGNVTFDIGNTRELRKAVGNA